MVTDGRHLHLVAKLRPGRGGDAFEWLPASLGAELRRVAEEHDKVEAFLEESLEATTMHEPLPYPADRLEWVGSLQADLDTD